jgi:hypothetical protein
MRIDREFMSYFSEKIDTTDFGTVNGALSFRLIFCRSFFDPDLVEYSFIRFGLADKTGIPSYPLRFMYYTEGKEGII